MVAADDTADPMACKQADAHFRRETALKLKPHSPSVVLRSNDFLLYEAHMLPLLKGPLDESSNGVSGEVRVRQLCEGLSATEKQYCMEQTN